MFRKIKPVLSAIKWKCHWLLQWFRRMSSRPITAWLGGHTPAICRLNESRPLTSANVIAGYAQGIFATGKSNGGIEWHSPAIRGVINSDQVHISKRLQTYLRKSTLQITYDTDFDGVMQGCADRDTTWITSGIADIYRELHELGFAHSVEAYQDGKLVGGGYGVAIGDVFFLESMFCTQDHASKIAFVRLAEKLHRDGFAAIDCQFLSEHWKRFGAQPVPRDEFENMVAQSLGSPVKFTAEPIPKPIAPGVESNEGFSGLDACTPLRAQLAVSCHSQPYE